MGFLGMTCGGSILRASPSRWPCWSLTAALRTWSWRTSRPKELSPGPDTLGPWVFFLPISQALSLTQLACLTCPHQAAVPVGCLIPGRDRSEACALSGPLGACREGPTVVLLRGQKQAAGTAEGPAPGLPGTQRGAEEEDL